MKSKQGQGLIELLISVAVVILVTTGVIALMVKTMGTRNKGFDRNKATRLGTVVVEDMIRARNDSNIDFFKINPGTTDYQPVADMTSFVGYTFTVVYSDVVCVGGSCREAVVNVGWSGSLDTVTMRRLFSRY